MPSLLEPGWGDASKKRKGKARNVDAGAFPLDFGATATFWIWSPNPGSCTCFGACWIFGFAGRHHRILAALTTSATLFSCVTSCLSSIHSPTYPPLLYTPIGHHSQPVLLFDFYTTLPGELSQPAANLCHSSPNFPSISDSLQPSTTPSVPPGL